MPGGLLNIVAYGDQNVFIHGNPTKTHFKTSYAKHTNFGLQKFRIDFSGSRTLRMDEHTTMDFKIPRYAELLMDTYVVVTMPHIWSPVIPPDSSVMSGDGTGTPAAGAHTRWRPYDFKWIDNLGSQMIHEVELTIGSQTIQKFSGDYMHNMVLRDFGVTKRTLYDEMTGHTKEMNDPANAYERRSQYPTAYSGDGAACEPSIRGRKLYIPLNTWFTMSNKMAFPLASLQYNELNIRITFRPIRDLFVIRDVMSSSYDPTVPTLYTRAQKGVPDHSFHRFLHSPPGLHVLTDDYPSDRTDWTTDIHLISTYAFLSDEEVKLFSGESQTYLIKEVYEHTFPNLVNSNRQEIVSNGMVSSWMWFFRRSDAVSRNQWSNYTNWPYLYQPIDLLVAPTDDEYGVGGIVGERSYGPGTDPNSFYGDSSVLDLDTNTFITGDYRPNNHKYIMEKCAMLFDGKYRENEMDAGIFSYIDKYTRTRGYASNGLYCYNFCLDTSPYTQQPSGAINLSKFNTIELEFATITPPVSDRSMYTETCDPVTGLVIGDNMTQSWKLYEYVYDLIFIEERYNILKFISGNASLMYAR